MEFKANAMNQLAAGDVLFEDGDPILYVFMVVKGKVEVYSGSVKMTMGVGSFIGLNGLSESTYVGECKAIEPTSIYAFKFDGSDSVTRILSTNKDYNGIALYCQNRIIADLQKNYKDFLSCAGSLYLDVKEQYETVLTEARKARLKVSPMTAVATLKEYNPTIVPDIERVQYYLDFSRVPLESIKSFYTVSAFMTKIHVSEQLHLISQLICACDEIISYVKNVFNLLVASPDNSVYKQELILATKMKEKEVDDKVITKLINDNLGKLDAIGHMIEERTANDTPVDKEKLDYIYSCFQEGKSIEDDGEDNSLSGDIAAYLASLDESTKQLFDYADFSKEKIEKFNRELDAFMALSDKENQEDTTRKLRKQIAESFYDLYRIIFKKSYGKSNLPKAVELFLDYGYVSEKLLDEDQIISLLKLSQPKQCGECRVYTIREWLGRIYEGLDEPSRNDMGQDYTEVLREMKKQKEIDEDREKELLADNDAKLEFEIKNVFIPANRIVNGQLTTFVPWLYKEAFLGSLGKAFVDRERVNATYEEILKIDYSVFHRETLYTDPEAGIEREYEQKKVPPVFILFPNCGINGSMWQEITGRKRDTEARLFLPLFTYSNLTDIMIKLFGHFRWALCKTIQGTNWNNIQVHSLTSEYSDYIQFYKKNHDLSDERKEKLKLQIQRGRNNLREIFTLDYITWMQNEATGAVRMNKVAREILATYCPFSYDIRKNLIKQPIYEEAFTRNLRERGKKVKEMELRFKGLERKNVVIPDVLRHTLEFYRAY